MSNDSLPYHHRQPRGSLLQWAEEHRMNSWEKSSVTKTSYEINEMKSSLSSWALSYEHKEGLCYNVTHDMLQGGARQNTRWGKLRLLFHICWISFPRFKFCFSPILSSALNVMLHQERWKVKLVKLVSMKSKWIEQELRKFSEAAQVKFCKWKI